MSILRVVAASTMRIDALGPNVEVLDHERRFTPNVDLALRRARTPALRRTARADRLRHRLGLADSVCDRAHAHLEPIRSAA
jgi:hypothetical protein